MTDERSSNALRQVLTKVGTTKTAKLRSPKEHEKVEAFPMIFETLPTLSQNYVKANDFVEKKAAFRR